MSPYFFPSLCQQRVRCWPIIALFAKSKRAPSQTLLISTGDACYQLSAPLITPLATGKSACVSTPATRERGLNNHPHRPLVEAPWGFLLTLPTRGGSFRRLFFLTPQGRFSGAPPDLIFLAEFFGGFFLASNSWGCSHLFLESSLGGVLAWGSSHLLSVAFLFWKGKNTSFSFQKLSRGCSTPAFGGVLFLLGESSLGGVLLLLLESSHAGVFCYCCWRVSGGLFCDFLGSLLLASCSFSEALLPCGCF